MNNYELVRLYIATDFAGRPLTAIERHQMKIENVMNRYGATFEQVEYALSLSK